MAAQQHAITLAARRAGFWPSIAVASSRLRPKGLHGSGEGSLEILRSSGAPRPTPTSTTLTGECAMTVSGRRLSRLGARAHRCGTAVARTTRRAQRVTRPPFPTQSDVGWARSSTLEAGDDRSGLRLSGQAVEDGATRRARRTGRSRSTRDGTMSSADDESEASPPETARLQPTRPTTTPTRRPRANLRRGRRHRRLRPVQRERRRLRRRRRRVVCRFPATTRLACP